MAWLFSPAEGGPKGTKCRVEALGTEQKGAEPFQLCPAQWRAQNEFLRSWDRVGSKIEKRVLKTRSVTCGLIRDVKMMLCFNSSSPKIALSCVLGYPLNSGGDFEESLADPARTLGSPLKTREWLVAANIQTIPWILPGCSRQCWTGQSRAGAAIHGHEERAPGFSVNRAGTKSCSGSDPAELYFSLLDGCRLSSGRLEKWGFLAAA